MSKLLVFSIIIYSIFSSIVVYYTSEVFFDTVESISIPNGYISVNLSTTDPELKISFGVSNTGLFDISDLYLNISLDIEYYKNGELNSTFANIFQKITKYQRISGLQQYEDIIVGNSSCFNLLNIIDFQSDVNQSKFIKYLLSVEINGLYCFKLLQFHIKIKKIPIYVL